MFFYIVYSIIYQKYNKYLYSYTYTKTVKTYSIFVIFQIITLDLFDNIANSFEYTYSYN